MWRAKEIEFEKDRGFRTWWTAREILKGKESSRLRGVLIGDLFMGQTESLRRRLIDSSLA